MKTYLLRVVYRESDPITIEAKSPRAAVMDALSLSRSPRMQKIWRSIEGGKKRVHVGYTIGQGRGNETLWVYVDQMIPCGRV